MASKGPRILSKPNEKTEKQSAAKGLVKFEALTHDSFNIAVASSNSISLRRLNALFRSSYRSLVLLCPGGPIFDMEYLLLWSYV